MIFYEDFIIDNGSSKTVDIPFKEIIYFFLVLQNNYYDAGMFLI